MVAVLTIGRGTMDADADETWKRGNGMPFANFMVFFFLCWIEENCIATFIWMVATQTFFIFIPTWGGFPF